MSKREEPDWLAELAKGGEALQREAMRIIRAAEQFAASGHARPLARRITRAAVDAAVRELLSASERPVVQVTAGLATAAATAPSPTLTFSGSVVLAPARVSGQVTVQEPDLIERNIGRILALVLLAIVTSGLLGVQGPDRTTVDHYLTVLSFALSIAVLVWAGHK